jgi:hypothetical protein
VVSTEVTAFAGTLRVIVPAGAALDVRARARAGRVTVFGARHDGAGVDRHLVTAGSGLGPLVRLDVRAGYGTVTVERAPSRR